jgi:hypothetical protein
MQVNIDRNNRRTVRLTKPEIKALRKAKAIVDNVVSVDPDFAEQVNERGLELDMLLAMPMCQDQQEEQLPTGAPEGKDGED